MANRNSIYSDMKHKERWKILIIFNDAAKESDDLLAQCVNKLITSALINTSTCYVVLLDILKYLHTERWGWWSFGTLSGLLKFCMYTIQPTHTHTHSHSLCLFRGGNADSSGLSVACVFVSVLIYKSTVFVAGRWRGLRSSLSTLFLAQCGRKCVTGPLITRRDLLHTHTQAIYVSTAPISHTHTHRCKDTHSIVKSLTDLLLSGRESLKKRLLSNASV